jgi:hypothetical protein
VTIKIVNNANPGTVDLVGGNDWDNLATALNLGESYTYLVDKSGSTIYVKNTAGEVAHSSTVARTEIQWAIDNVPSAGGTILLAPNTDFDLGSAAADGVTIDNTKTKYVNFLGSGMSTIIRYTGTGAAIKGTCTPPLSSFPKWRIGNFTLYGHTDDPFTSANSTIVAGRNGLHLLASVGQVDIGHIWFRHLDVGIWTDCIEFSNIHDIKGFTSNTGIKVTGDVAINTCSGNHITDFFFAGMKEYGIYYNATGSSFESCYIGRGQIQAMLHGIRVDSIAYNVTIEDIYFEASSTAEEATYGETIDCVWLKGTSSFPNRQVILRNLRCGGLDNADNTFTIEYTNKVTIDTCVAKGFRNAMVLVNSNGSAMHLRFVNPDLRAHAASPTPWLVDVPSDNFFSGATARMLGTVEEVGDSGTRWGIIVQSSASGYIEGDVVRFGSGRLIVAATTTANHTVPAVIMYGAKAANRPCVIAVKGITKVNMTGATTYADTICTSTTTKKAAVNNAAVDPKTIIGYAVNDIASAGLVEVKIL